MTDRRVQSVGYLVNWAARLLARSLDRRLEGGNLGPMPVYYALLDGGALPQKELARLAAVEQPTMANTLARMTRDGLVTAAPDPADRRSSLIRLTPLGQERGRSAMAAAATVNRLALEALSPEEREPFMAMLRKVIARLDADGEGRTVPPARIG
ncbi:MAG TPA: MarR family transcriptional regulator [Devosia sp.]|nr:MarR family transcriptional regulator [Devosia sp.]